MKIQRKIQELWECMFDTSSDDYEKLSGYSYYAFISYTEKDEKWAEWLQWELEHYNIPTKVRSEYKELPVRIRPVFWYKNDLAGAHLSGAIKKELEQSKYLIVVCSPSSANKEWVNDEVCIFKDELGRGDKIIPFVVDGEIKSNNSELECLPRPLRNLPREKELRCIDVRDYGKNKALVNIVSTLLDIRFDVLWDRFKREQHRRFATYCAILTIIMVVLFGCWNYFLHTKYEYFIDIADCNGMPTGIIQISNDDANSHYRMYRFEKRRGLLRRVVYVDCDGNPQNHTNTELVDRPCIQELSYNNGELSSIECKDATNKTMFIMHLSKDKLAVDLKDEEENQAANFIFSSTSVDQGLSFLQQSAFLAQLLISPSKIGRYIYERDEAGYIIKKIYARNNGDNDISMDANGISGFEYERDSLHRVVRIRFLDNHYEYKSNHMGVAGKKYEYDVNGNLSIAEYVDKEGNLKSNEHHWAKAIDTYDSKGFCIEERVFGADGEPCISALGYHRMTVSTNGKSETISFFDIHNNPTYSLPLGESPGGYSIISNIRNEKGQVVEIQFKDSNGNLCYNQHRVAICKIDYDNNGLVTDVYNYGKDNRPCSNINGFFHQHNSYNPNGALTETSFYNITEKPAQNNLGIHRIIIKYDHTGQRMTEAHAYNSNNLPLNCLLLNGAAWVKFGYDGSSKWVSEIFFYSFDNKPIETSAGAKVRYERDSYGQIIACKYYNTNYELSSDVTNCAIMELEYNDMGMVTDYRYFDENKAPVSISGSGVYHVGRSYSKTGQLNKICLYDSLQSLQIGPEGWAIQEIKYKNGIISSTSYYGEEEEPVEVMGVHKYVSEIDDSGNLLSQSAYGKDMRPAINIDISAHKVAMIYDDNRRIVERDYYDSISSTPFVCIRIKYNIRGLQTEQTAYNSRDELVESPLNFGVAKLQSKYDSQDRVVFMRATNNKGRIMNTTYGFAEAHTSYTDNINEAVFLDSQMKPTNNVSIPGSFAYYILYLSETGEQLYAKRLRILYDNSIEAVRDAYCYDAQGQQVQKVIHCENDMVKVYNALNNQTFNYYSFDDEYDEYVHILDSIQNDIEMKYGKPKLYKYVK